MNTPERILLVSTTAIGDTVMATPFIRAVRKCYPKAHISVLAHKKRMALLAFNPYIDDLQPYHGKGKKVLGTFWLLRKARFDLAIVLHANDPDIVPLVRWSGAPIRVGWGESKWAQLFTHTIRRADPPEHFMIHKKRLLESVGIPVKSLQTDIFLQLGDAVPFQQKLVPWLKKNSPGFGYVVMHAFGTNPQKWWPLENFFAVADHIYEKHHWTSVFVGDDETLTIVEKHPRFKPSRHYAANGCTLRESAYIIKHAYRMITTDSGPMHLAFALRCPTLCLFGPTKPAIHGPCFDLDRHHAIHHDPLTELRVEEVIPAWDKFVQAKSA